MLRNLLPLVASHSPLIEAEREVGEPFDSTTSGPIFLVDDNNWLLTASISSIVNGRNRGPLTLVGPTGSGKTTLSLAIVAAWPELARQIQHPAPEASIGPDQPSQPTLTIKPLITTGADFARAYANAVEADAIDDFRRRHYRAGLVVIDGLQGLAQKPAAQQELRNLLDRLRARGVTVVCTSSVAPLRDPNLTPDLASRLAGGQVAPIAPPTEAVSRALLDYHIARTSISLDDSARAELVAFLVHRKPRLSAVALRNAIGELSLRVSQTGVKFSAIDVKAHFQRKLAPTLTPREIALSVGKWLNVRWDDLKGPSREQSVVRARGLAIFLIRELTGQSLSAIGELFGDRDHTTVMNACQRIAHLLATDVAMQAAYGALVEQLSNGASRSEAQADEAVPVETSKKGKKARLVDTQT